MPCPIKMLYMTEEQAYQRVTTLCARAEYCLHDLRTKLVRYELPMETVECILKRLVDEKYVDEKRYAHAFVRDKFRYNHWGERRIEQELRLRRIPSDIISDALTELDDEATLDTLRDLIAKKRPSVKGKNDYDVRCKLIRFALGRGFAMDDILKVIGEGEGSSEDW